jgi:hypothetical protein
LGQEDVARELGLRTEEAPVFLRRLQRQFLRLALYPNASYGLALTVAMPVKSCVGRRLPINMLKRHSVPSCFNTCTAYPPIFLPSTSPVPARS